MWVSKWQYDDVLKILNVMKCKATNVMQCLILAPQALWA